MRQNLVDLPSFSIVRRRADCASLVTERFGHYVFLIDFLVVSSFTKWVALKPFLKWQAAASFIFVSVPPKTTGQLPSRKLTSNTPSSRLLVIKKLRMTVLSVVKLFNSTNFDWQFYPLKSRSNIAFKEQVLAIDGVFPRKAYIQKVELVARPGHGVCLVKDDNLEWWAWSTVWPLATGGQLGKVLDLVTHHLDPSLVWSDT